MKVPLCRTGRLSSSEIWYCIMSCIMRLVFSRLPREIAESPSLEIFKPCLDCSGQTSLADPAWSEGVDQMIFRAAFKPQPLCESQFLKTKYTTQKAFLDVQMGSPVFQFVVHISSGPLVTHGQGLALSFLHPPFRYFYSLIESSMLNKSNSSSLSS